MNFFGLNTILFLHEIDKYTFITILTHFHFFKSYTNPIVFYKYITIKSLYNNNNLKLLNT